MRSCGPYQILRQLGEGGVGRVYEARNPASSVVVALKLPKAGGSAQRAMFRREIALLQRLVGAGTGIVQLIDAQSESDEPWYAMQYVAGVSLADCLQDDSNVPRHTAPTAPLPVAASALGSHTVQALAGARPARAADAPAPALNAERRRRLLADVAHALGVIHRHGIVHGDVTPQNIMLRDGALPVLIDFGSAFADHLVLSVRDTVRDGVPNHATPAYAAPELAAGLRGDARSDLYSLGRLIQHVLAPAAREGTSAGFAPDLAHLVLRLTQKRPEDRPSSAFEIEEWLRGAAPPPSSGVRVGWRSSLVGRELLLQEIESRLKSAAAGKGGVVFLAGEPGSGKTRLLNEAVTLALRSGFTAVACVCPDPASAASHGPATVVGALSDLASEPPPERSLSPELQRAASLDWIFTTLQQSSRKAPVCLVIDDMHWADDVALAFARSERLSALAGLPVLVLLAQWQEVTPPTTRYHPDPAYVSLRLRRLTEDEVRDVVGDMLGTRRLPPQLASWVYQNTDGNPLHVTECVRELLARSVVAQDSLPGSWRFDAAAASDVSPAGGAMASLSEWIAARLERVSEPTLRVAMLASLFGREFDSSDLEPLREELWPEDPAVAQAMAELLSTGIVETRAGSRYRYSHHLYLRWSIALRERKLAPEAAASLGRHLVEQPRAASVSEASLGYIWSAARAHEQAFGHLLAAAEEAALTQDSRRAHQLLEASLAELVELASPARERFKATSSRAHALLAESFTRSARAEEADQQYLLALEALGSSASAVARATLLQRRGRALGLGALRRPAVAEALFCEAEQVLAEAPRGPEWWDISIEVATSRFWTQYYDRQPFTATFDELEAVIVARGSARQKCDLYQCACAYRLAAGGYQFDPRAVEHARTALALIEAEPALRERLPDAQMVAAFPQLWGVREDWQGAAALMTKAEQGATWLEDARLLAQVRTYSALAHRRLGEVERADAKAIRALSAARRCDSLGYMGAAFTTRAWAAWRRGENDLADGLVRDARACWRDGTLRHPFQCFLNLIWADLCRLREDFAQARALLRETEAPDQHRLPARLRALIQHADEEGLAPIECDAALSAVTREAVDCGYL